MFNKEFKVEMVNYKELIGNPKVRPPLHLEREMRAKFLNKIQNAQVSDTHMVSRNTKSL